MHEENRAHDEERERLEVPNHLFAKRGHMHADTGVRFRVLHGNARCDRFQFRARLFDRDALLHLPDAIEKEVAARIIFLIHLERHPEVANFRETPTLRHHADDRYLLAVNWNRFADDTAIATEMILPDLVPDQRDGRGVELVFFRTK